MALIKCPECGREVSDRTNSCPQCGFPISSLRTDGTVMIKITNGLAGKVIVFSTLTKRTLWEGRAGETAVFNIDKPIEISVTWGIFSGNKTVNKNCTATVKAGEKYELAWRRGFLVEEITLKRVDVIDSGS